MKRILLTLLAVAGLAGAALAQDGSPGAAFKSRGGRIEQYFLKGYNDYRNPTAVVSDSIGSNGTSSYQFVGPWVPIHGARMAVLHVTASNEVNDSTFVFSIASIDTLDDNSSIAEVTTYDASAASATHGVSVYQNEQSGLGKNFPKSVVITPPQGDDMTNATSITARWIRPKLRSRRNGVNSAGSTIRNVRMVMSVFYDENDGGQFKDVDLLVPQLPYSASSPWNIPISHNARVHANSDSIMANIADEADDAPIAGWGARNTTYSMPVYKVDSNVDSATVYFTGSFYQVIGDSLTYRYSSISGVDIFPMKIPIPAGTAPASGTDAHVVIWNPQTGDEWGLWQANANVDTATNGYYYNTNWDAVPPNTPSVFGSRGAGLPYFAGLIMREEIRRGVIKHAIAAGVPNILQGYFVCPATKTDGDTTMAYKLWEGARLRLKRSYDIEGSSLSNAGKTVARAMRDYGIIIVDGSGTCKIYAEVNHSGDAIWDAAWSTEIVRAIPWSAFEVLDTSQDCTP